MSLGRVIEDCTLAEDDESLHSYDDEEFMETAGTEDGSDPRPWINMDETLCLAIFTSRGRQGHSRLTDGPPGNYGVFRESMRPIRELVSSTGR
jgi:hypothetical protein